MAIEIEVKSVDDGCRADDFLQRSIPTAPAGYLHQLFKKKKVRRGGEPLSADALLASGETVELPASERMSALLELAQQQPRLDILFENDEILIADKPAGLAVHAAVGHETVNLTTLLQQQAERAGAKYRIAPVQRLDLETSGACLFGKGRRALAELGELVTARGLKKTYLTLATGRYAGPAELVSSVRAKGKLKEARCRVRILAQNDRASLLEIELLTGRQHQIRQQLAQYGHPLFGDRRYHGPCPPELPRVFLHSWRLAFHSPFGGEPIAVTAELPDELRFFLPRIGLSAQILATE